MLNLETTMKKLIVTLSLAAVAALLATNAASAASFGDSLTWHQSHSSKPALRNSPRVRHLLSQAYQQTSTSAVGSTSPDGIIEYGSAFTAPVIGVGLAPMLSTCRATSYRHGAVIKPGNRHHWMR